MILFVSYDPELKMLFKIAAHRIMQPMCYCIYSESIQRGHNNTENISRDMVRHIVGLTDGAAALVGGAAVASAGAACSHIHTEQKGKGQMTLELFLLQV